MKTLLSICSVLLLWINCNSQNIFHEDFEIVDSVISSGSGVSGFYQSTALAAGGMASIAATYDLADTAELSTIPFSTLGSYNIFLDFDQIAKVEFFDAGEVLISSDGGITWTKLTSAQYMGSSNFPAQGNKFTEAAYTQWLPGDTTTYPNNFWWMHETFDISALAANSASVIIKFKMRDLNYNGIKGRAGWFIDNIHVGERNSIKGKAFADLNSNMVQDLNEPDFPAAALTESNTGALAITQQDGSYLMTVYDTGNFVVQATPSGLWNPNPSSHTASFTAFSSIDSLNDFAFQPTGIVDDYCASVTSSGPFRSGFSAVYYINYQNIGTTNISPVIVFFPDADISFTTSNPLATAITTDSIVWNLPAISPFQSGSIFVQVLVDPGLPLSTSITSSVNITPYSISNQSCHLDTSWVLTIGSYDPNDITVNRNQLLTTEFPTPPALDYTINFQNTGNDTAFTVKIDNPISSLLDINSFQFVASSHPVNITYINETRRMKYIFNNILLADSNINEPASHGFVRYRIKPLPSLAAGDSIKNNGGIFFDTNSPVATNTAITVIVLPTGIENLSSTVDFFVFPNPATDMISIKSNLHENKPVCIKLLNILGEILITENQNSFSEIDLSLRSLSGGVYMLMIETENKIFNHKILKM